MRRTINAILLAGTGVALATSIARSMPGPQAPGAPIGEPVILESFTYEGNASCSGSDCHSGTAKEQSGQLIGDELDIWTDHDPHSRALRSLGPANAASKTIADALGIADPLTNERCTSCHATNVPAAQRGELFAFAAEGVSCENCHGPADKWLEPHKEAGWTAKKRTEMKADEMLRTLGLRDTAHLPTRAALCVSCHLKIDKALVDAGHPPLKFELNWFNHYSWHGDYTDRIHWSTDVKVIDGMQWAAGMPAAAAAAKRQVDAWGGADAAPAIATLAQIYEGGAAIASRHFGVSGGTAPDAKQFTASACAAAAADVAQTLGPLAKTKDQQAIVQNSMLSLAAATAGARGKSIYDEGGMPDAYWDADEAANAAMTAGDHDAFVSALKAMAAAMAE